MRVKALVIDIKKLGDIIFILELTERQNVKRRVKLKK